MKQISRRSALSFIGMTPAFASNRVTTASDAVLLELGCRFDAIANQLDHDCSTDWRTLREFDLIVTRIVATPATTLEGLYVKARAGCWVLLGDFESADQSAAGAPMAYSIMRDLIRLRAPHLENPGALRRLIQEIEDGAKHREFSQTQLFFETQTMPAAALLGGSS